MGENPRIIITLQDDFKAFLKDHQKRFDLPSLAAALLDLAERGAKTEYHHVPPARTGWGGYRRGKMRKHKEEAQYPDKNAEELNELWNERDFPE